jgi:hypothetical protein
MDVKWFLGTIGLQRAGQWKEKWELHTLRDNLSVGG